jgi:hypothetical protein
MNIENIEQKLNEIFQDLEKEVMEILSDQTLDKRDTNLRMRPLTSTKQILTNALESIKMVDKLAQEDIGKPL